jgi:hypothetical protein
VCCTFFIDTPGPLPYTNRCRAGGGTERVLPPERKKAGGT